MSRSAPCATLIGRLTLALQRRMEEGISDTWIQELAKEALTHTAAELVAFEQDQGQPCSLTDAALFLTSEITS